MGFWDFTLFEIGILEIRFEIGILALRTGDLTLLKSDLEISPLLKSGLWDFTPFQIAILGFQDPPPLTGPYKRLVSCVTIHTASTPSPPPKKKQLQPIPI